MTAVEYIIEQMQSGKWEYTPWSERKVIIEQALEMEKQQIKDVIEMARDSSICECALGTHIEYEHTERTIIEKLKQ